MTRYADPQRCPDCGAPIAYGAPACPSCGLPLGGDLARELFVTLTRADEILGSLRSTQARAAAGPVPAEAARGRVFPPPGPAAPLATGPVPTGPLPTGPVPSGPVPPAAPHLPRRGLSAASVPKILLTLGAACLLVAALVFLVVTWSRLGVAGRTATLVGFTAVAAGLTRWLAGRGLRAATESLGLVTLGLLALDVVGAEHAGWLGTPSGAGFRVLLGLLLAAVATAAAVGVRRTAAGGFTGGEVVAALGTATAATGVAGLSWLETSPALVVTVLLCAAATAGLWMLRLVVAAAGTGLVTAAAWAALVLVALDRAGTHPGVGPLWSGLEVWPLLVAAALVAAVALLRPLPLAARVTAAGVGYLLLTVAVAMPALDEAPTPLTLAGLAVLAVTGALTWLLPRPWALVGSFAQVVAGAGVLLAAVSLGSAAVGRVADASADPWTAEAGVRYPAWLHPGLPAPWLLPLAVLALVGTLLLLAAATPVVDAVVRPAVDSRVGAALVLVVAASTLADYPVPVATLVALLLLGAGGLVAAWWRRQDPVLLVLALGALLAGVGASLPAEWLTLAAAVVGLALAAAAHLRARVVEVAMGAGLLVPLLLGATAWCTGAVTDADWTWTALAALLLLGALVLAAPYAPAGWWAAPAAVARDGLEVGAATAALPLGAAGVLLAAPGAGATWASVYLTVAGAVLVAGSLLRPDRRLLGWPGGVLLAAASWVRLWDLGVHAPEPYTLPAALALLVVGLVHLRRDPDAGTVTALGAGLALGLVPSLLWALDDPASLRSLLLGLACFGLVVAGVRLRWTAPLAFGAGVGGLLVVRLAAPYIGEAVPRWVLIGAAGAVLMVMGVTWESRLREARRALGYLRTLR